MTVPPLPPAPAPAAWLAVRLGPGPAAAHPLPEGEFLVGGAAGCDLVLPGSNLPPVACQFSLTPAGFTLRRLTSALPVLLNDAVIPDDAPRPLADGDRVSVGPAGIEVHAPAEAYLVPRLVAFDADPPPVAAHEARLRRFQDELVGLRETLRRQFEAEAARPDPATDLARRREELEAEYRAAFARLQQEFADRPPPAAPPAAASPADDELARREEQYRTDLARLDRRQAALDARQAEIDRRAAEVDARFEQLRSDTAELEEQVRLAAAEEDRRAADTDRLDRLRADLDARAALLAERSSRLEAQQAALAVLRSKLDRQQEEAEAEGKQLAADRERLLTARRELDARLHEAEQLRAELGSVKADHESQHRALIEQHSLLAATLADIQRQKDAAAAEDERLKAKEAELDARSAEAAEQAAILKARAAQVADLHARLEADRLAVRDREGMIGEAESARQALGEQLRRRNEELSARAKQLDEQARRLADDRAAVERDRAAAAESQARADEAAVTIRREAEARAAELQRDAATLAEREAALSRQVARLADVGRSVAAERKAVAEARAALTADREAAEAFRAAVAGQMAELRREAPELEGGAAAALEKLAAARDVLRGHLSELHEYAKQARDELDAARGHLRAEADALRQRESELEAARADHRLAVAGFRQQLLDWQSQVGELKQTLARSESKLERDRAAVDAATKQADATTRDLARQEAALRDERAAVAERRAEVERHLSDMRDWYRKKLREIAAGRPLDESDMPGPDADDLDPGDKHLGELLRSRGLIDADTLRALWAEAARQRRSLRQVLLAGGAVTLYQLALIEAGNLDSLVLGRLRVIDRVRATTRETVYRVFDPSRGGVFLLRHLSEAEAQDAVHPDEFRQRFAAAAAAAHPTLANTLEVLDVNGRPAALQEWVVGVPSPDWPVTAGTPGVWLKLLTDAARGLNHAHRAGLVHGRLAPESFVLTADGQLKLLGFGEPPWLAGAANADPLPAADLRALGAAAYGWAQLGGRKKGGRGKPFPPVLAGLVRRLESGVEPPMADVVAFDRPFADAAELLRELARLSEDYPPPAGEWEKLTAAVADALLGATAVVRQSA